jgi:hypothetical protein
VQLKIDWGQIKVAQQTPTCFPPTSSGSPCTVYAFLPEAEDATPTTPEAHTGGLSERLCAMVSSQVALEGRLAGELLRFGVAPTDIRVVEDQRVLHRLVAASLIRYLINHPNSSVVRTRTHSAPIRNQRTGSCTAG